MKGTTIAHNFHLLFGYTFGHIMSDFLFFFCHPLDEQKQKGFPTNNRALLCPSKKGKRKLSKGMCVGIFRKYVSLTIQKKETRMPPHILTLHFHFSRFSMLRSLWAFGFWVRLGFWFRIWAFGVKTLGWFGAKKLAKVACFLCLTFRAIEIRDLCKGKDNIPRSYGRKNKIYVNY